MANFRYSHLFTTKIGNEAIQAAAAKLKAAEIALAITDGQEKILFKNAEGEVVAVATEEQILALLSQVNQWFYHPSYSICIRPCLFHLQFLRTDGLLLRRLLLLYNLSCRARDFL